MDNTFWGYILISLGCVIAFLAYPRIFFAFLAYKLIDRGLQICQKRPLGESLKAWFSTWAIPFSMNIDFASAKDKKE